MMRRSGFACALTCLASVLCASADTVVLPSGYTRLEYVQGDGATSRLTVALPDSRSVHSATVNRPLAPYADKVEIDFALAAADAQQCVWCGTYVANVPNYSRLFWIPSSGFRYDYFNQYSDVFFGSTCVAETRYTVTATNNVAGLSEADRTVRTKASDFTAGPKVLQLFASYGSADGQGETKDSANFSTMKLYGFKVTNETGVPSSPKGLICDLVPVRDPSGKVCFFDATMGCRLKHYGTFVAGPAASPFRIAEIERQYTDGATAATPHPAVTDPATGALLTEGADYTLSWANNTLSTRKATVTVTGKAGSSYEGESMTATFEIQAGVPFRTMAVTTNKKSGAITSFDLSFGAAPAATPLYLAYGHMDGGATTNGWAHLVKLADIPAGVQALNVPITAIPDWGSAEAQFARFFLKPGDLFVGYESLYSSSKWWYVTDCYLTSRDTVEMDFRVESSSRYGAHWVGCYDGTAPKARLCTAYAGSNKMRTYFGMNGTGNSYDIQTAASTDIYNGRSNIRFGCDGYTMRTNEVLFASYDYDYPGEAFTCTEPMTFWHTTNYEAQKEYGYERGEIYHVTVLRDGAVNRTFYPCATNGVCCFYDTATQTFCSPLPGSDSSGYGVGSDDHGPVSASIAYTPSPLPEGEGLYVVATNTVSGRLFGTVSKLGFGATSVDVYFAYAPKGTALPELALVQAGLVQGDRITAAVTGLTPHQEYDYAIDLKNNLGESMAVRVEGTFVARPVHSWTGAAGNNDFLDDANWDIGAPMEGGEATVPSGVSAMLSRPTPTLYSLTVAGTITTTNWLTKLSADIVKIPAGGVVTCVGPFTGDENEASNRVWIACRDLTIDAGGAIDVNDRGYDGGRALRTPGYGPGTSDAGASHGGFGGGPSGSSCHKAPYDDPIDPTVPGSGGNGGASNIGMPGGGAVKIDATGRVTVNGAIKASATRAATGTYNTLGSGGSISIGCASFVGTNGQLLAEAAVVNTTSGKENGGYPGGGGRIAIRTTAQTDGLVSGMTISVREGLYQKTPQNDQDVHRLHADLGTLWFTDSRLLESFGTGISGQILGFSEYTFDNLTISSGHVRLAAEGVKLMVAGDLTISGATARLELGGYCVTNRVYDLSPYCGTTPPELSVGGDMTIEDGARFDVYSAETNGLGSVGAKLEVSGTLTVGASSKLTAGSDEVNGGAPKFSVGNLVVEETGVFTADARGFAGGTTLGSAPNKGAKGKGPGGGDRIGTSGNVGYNKYIGGGYGGIGGWSVTGGSTCGLSYGDEWRPTLPGSGGAGQTWTANAGSGGGVIDVTATGSIRIDGTVSANGGNFYKIDPNVGGGSGGAVYLKAATFSGAATGVISADGQGRSNQANGGAGAGGRIAIWTGALPYAGRVTKTRVHKQQTAFVMPDESTYLGTVTASGGTNTKEESGDANATDGTVWFVNVDKPGGLILLYR